MREIIETNMSFSYIKEIPEFYINIKDYQSRIVKIPDWKVMCLFILIYLMKNFESYIHIHFQLGQKYLI